MPSESIKMNGQYGLLIRQTQDRLYVIMDETKIHLRRLPVSAMTKIDFVTQQPVSLIKKHIRQSARRHHQPLTQECQEALAR